MVGWLGWLLTLPVRVVDHLLHFTQLGVVEVVAVRSDARSPELVHLWYARTPTGAGRVGSHGAAASGRVRLFGHVALHTRTWRLTAGLQQSGVELELDSPFAERSLARVSQRLGLPTALGPAARTLAGCPLHPTRAPDPRPPLPDGPALLLHEREVDGGADAVSGEVHELRYVHGQRVRWTLSAQSLWMGKRFVFAGPDGTAWLLYHGLDLRMRAWKLDGGDVLADRYVIGGLL